MNNPIVLTGLFDVVKQAEQICWQPFREGVEIHRLYGDGVEGSTAVLLRYQAGSKIPLHEHPGYEHLFILAGLQEDEQGSYEAGTLVINRPGTRHRVVSSAGCIVLAIYEKPVRFIPENL